MNCQRCSSTRAGAAVAHIRSEVLNLQVCGTCAQEAIELGLHVEPLEPVSQRQIMRIPAAACFRATFRSSNHLIPRGVDFLEEDRANEKSPK